MTALRSWILAAVTAAGLVACGGGDPYVPGSVGTAGGPTTPGSFTRVVSFGDSLSDLGTYKPATSLAGGGAPPYFGGKFTTNATTDTISLDDGASVWVENVAAALGLVVTPAEVGFGAQSVACPAAAVPALAASCTGYGQGGARVTDPNGIGKAGGALTVPLQAQIANHLAAFGGFDADDLILAKGGVYVAVLNLPDIAGTPFGASVPASARPVLSSLSEVFNLWLLESLKRQPVRWVDTMDVFRRILADPAAFGVGNATLPACDAGVISAVTGGQVTDGSSLFCNATPGAPYNGLRAGADPSTWLFADGVHPTTGGHALLASEILAALRSAGWID